MPSTRPTACFPHRPLPQPQSGRNIAPRGLGLCGVTELLVVSKARTAVGHETRNVTIKIL